MRILVTGNTGFKGTWLSIYLSTLGHEVHGYSFEYHPDGLSTKIDSKQWLASQTTADVRDKEGLKKSFADLRPELVFHLAAQPIVLESIKDPVGTFDINVNGTLNVLEASKQTDSVERVLVTTSDKVYDQSQKASAGSKETDRLGGHDPYSYSKVCQDLVAQSFQKLNDGPQILIARAGNVLGGFDKGEHRLLPDVVESIKSKQRITIRNPDSTRPWQHVLDCVGGYVKFAFSDSPPAVLNFGPDESPALSVIDLVQKTKALGHDIEYVIDPDQTGVETKLLQIDSSLARNELNWRPVMSIEDAIKHSLMELDSGDMSSIAISSVSYHTSLNMGA